MKRKLIALILLTASLFLIIGAGYFYTHWALEVEKRQATEESIAEQYLLDARERDIEETQKADVNVPSEDFETDAEIVDENYYERGGVTYTPDYAEGTLDCVLEIPKISLKRGVYIGTTEQIDRDLDIWMTVAARPEYILGETHYCIYGHNHTEQVLSFNRLKEVEVGDFFTLTKDQTVYVYEVTDFFSEWRELVVSDYIDNFRLPKENCYIFTCGRDQYRYKDICVVGTLQEKVQLSEWTGFEDWRTGNESIETISDSVTSTVTKIDTELNVSLKGDSLLISLTDAEGELVPEAVLALFDTDGISLKRNGDPLIGQSPLVLSVEDLPNDTVIVAGAYDLDDFVYNSPKDVEITIRKEYRKVTVTKAEGEDFSGRRDRIIRAVIAALAVLDIIALVFVLTKMSFLLR